ncbi:MAG: hypothetical protein QOE92_1741 [Chloroflexota bacterium]|jgi:predicted metal-dependent hydrolase|nr:hypothetical protein [Chloroflexota bacterium]
MTALDSFAVSLEGLPLFATPPPGTAIDRDAGDRADDRVVVIRSSNHRRTISAQRRNGTIEVRIPADMSQAEEATWVARMVRRLNRRRRGASDNDLRARARSLADRYFGGDLLPESLAWSDNMTTRWGSCTIDTGAVRVSARMRDFPGWVIDYVLVHEMAHLRYRGHGPRFWSLVGRYPLTERARGYLLAKGGEEG